MTPIWSNYAAEMVTPNGMIELLAKTFATDAILLITTTRHDMRELR